MDALNKWLADYTQTPIGGVLVFLVALVVRISFDEWQRRKATRRSTRKKKNPASG